MILSLMRREPKVTQQTLPQHRHARQDLPTEMRAVGEQGIEGDRCPSIHDERWAPGLMRCCGLPLSVGTSLGDWALTFNKPMCTNQGEKPIDTEPRCIRIRNLDALRLGLSLDAGERTLPVGGGRGSDSIDDRLWPDASDKHLLDAVELFPACKDIDRE